MATSPESARTKILEGNWDDNTRWEFYLSNQMPPRELCTSVACVAIQGSGEDIVLMRNRRGWELLGGHIDKDEAVEEAFLRETIEEGGYTPDTYNLFGYRQIVADKPVRHNQRPGYYPYPISYVPHFVAVSDRPLLRPTGSPEEVLESRVFSLDEIGDLQISTEGIIRAGVEARNNLLPRAS